MFLWIAVLAWAIGLGAKLFDLVVVAGAWSAAPPASLKLLPYGPSYPIDPGRFFIPTSLVILLSSFGAAIAGWRAPKQRRIWLWLPPVLFLTMFVFTMVVFWPMNGTLYRVSLGEVGTMSPREIAQLAHRWVRLDWLRVGVMVAGLLCSVRAISITAE